jgi:acetyltransferase
MPIDVGGDATPERTLQVLKVLADDPEVDATLVLISPLAPARPSVLAQGIVDFAKQRRLTLCCCLMGGASVAEARRILEDAGIPVFRTPDTVIELFHNIATYYRNQQLLLQVPASGDKGEGDGGDGAAPSGNGRLLVEAVLAERRLELSAVEARSLLKGAGIPVPQTLLARSATEAMFAAEQLGLPVTLRLDRTLTCARPGPADVPRTHLATAEAVRAAFHEIVSTAGPAPSGGLAVAVEPWRPRPHARVLAISVYRDPVFGPVIQFGAGRHQAEVFGDREVALPPLNGVLARDLIERTRFSRTLDAYLDLPAVDRKAVERALLAVSGLVCELPWIRTLEIDPLLADERGVIATDVRVSLDYAMVADHRYGHMAIHPYPAHLCQEWPLADGRNVTVRPVRPEDAPLEQAFIDAMSDEARQFRFMDSRPLPASLAVRLTQVDYDRELAFIAVVEENGVERQIGSARYGQALDAEAVEFALAVDERWQKFGLGRRLMGLLADCARAKGYRRIVGDVLGDNTKMLRLMHSLGYAVQPHPDGGGLKRVSKVLNA